MTSFKLHPTTSNKSQQHTTWCANARNMLGPTMLRLVGFCLAFMAFFYHYFFVNNMPLNCINYNRPGWIRDDHTNPLISSNIFSSKHFSIWQQKEMLNCLNRCSVNYFITVVSLCMLMNNLIIVYTISNHYEKVDERNSSDNRGSG